jgi:hypothetical protein
MDAGIYRVGIDKQLSSLRLQRRLSVFPKSLIHGPLRAKSRALFAGFSEGSPHPALDLAAFHKGHRSTTRRLFQIGWPWNVILSISAVLFSLKHPFYGSPVETFRTS